MGSEAHSTSRQGRENHLVTKASAPAIVKNQFEVLELPTETESKDLATIGGQVFVLPNSSPEEDAETVARNLLYLVKWDL